MTQIGEDKREVINNNNNNKKIVIIRRQNNFLHNLGVAFLKFAAYSKRM